MRYKIPTIIGIVLIFGYFIMESFKNPSSIDPTQVVMVGKDTLGRDWGAIADRKEREKEEALKSSEESPEPSLGAPPSLLQGDDPMTRQKLNTDNYTTIEAADGREIITGYTPTFSDESQNYETRHQKETGRNTEPEMRYIE
jgi:hypothetical protein